MGRPDARAPRQTAVAADDRGFTTMFPEAGRLRPEIAQSWRRSSLSGLRPGAPADRFTVLDVDLRSRLLVAATPVLDAMAEELAGTGFFVALVDQESRVAALRFGERSVRATMEGLGAALGRPFREDTTGTNSIATAFELRQGIAVRGREHYLEAFKRLSCYGHPLIDPASRRLVGVLDITCQTRDDSPLLAPFLLRAVRDIERRLLNGAREAERRMLAAFQAAALHKTHPVLMLGNGIVLANPAAIETLDGADHALLFGLTADGPSVRPATRELALSSGRTARVAWSRDGDSGGTLFELFFLDDGANHVPRRARPDRELERHRERRLPVLVRGEPGSGRSTALRSLAGPAAPAVLDAVDIDRRGERAWLAALEGLAGEHDGLVAIEAVELLPEPVAAKAARVLRTAGAWFALTTSSAAELRGERAALAAHCIARVDLPPLRARRDELPELAQVILARHTRGRLRLTPTALEVLSGHPWPGNLRELEEVLRDVATRRSAGDVTVRDLPPAYQGSRRSRRLTPLEQAEHDAIVAALRASEGNKAHAARRLGISRTTLYNRIRALGVAL
ncbi:sigma-54-dependent Fis family transcriptional regulator [Actinoallomurus sp. CA-150999]|uniref:sigma-54-dependent Fis family transcriptional regulator n=1 Tax=Actinoallomurus sp. CA-150999 TaxID=3239887 RepID=UPI003D94EFFD